MAERIDIDYQNKNILCRCIKGPKGANQSGIVFEIGVTYKGFETVKILAKNSKLNSITTGVQIEFPVEEIDNIIKALKEIKNERFSNTI